MALRVGVSVALRVGVSVALRVGVSVALRVVSVKCGTEGGC